MPLISGWHLSFLPTIFLSFELKIFGFASIIHVVANKSISLEQCDSKEPKESSMRSNNKKNEGHDVLIDFCVVNLCDAMAINNSRAEHSKQQKFCYRMLVFWYGAHWCSFPVAYRITWRLMQKAINSLNKMRMEKTKNWLRTICEVVVFGRTCYPSFHALFSLFVSFSLAMRTNINLSINRTLYVIRNHCSKMPTHGRWMSGGDALRRMLFNSYICATRIRCAVALQAASFWIDVHEFRVYKKYVNIAPFETGLDAQIDSAWMCLWQNMNNHRRAAGVNFRSV